MKFDSITVTPHPVNAQVAADMAARSYLPFDHTAGIALAFCGCAVELEQIPREVVAAIVFPDATDRIEMGRDWLGKRTVAGCISADGELRAALGVFCERCQCPTQVYA